MTAGFDIPEDSGARRNGIRDKEVSHDIKQKQWQLYYLGYYGDSLKDIDGVWA